MAGATQYQCHLSCPRDWLPLNAWMRAEKLAGATLRFAAFASSLSSATSVYSLENRGFSWSSHLRTDLARRDHSKYSNVEKKAPNDVGTRLPEQMSAQGAIFATHYPQSDPLSTPRFWWAWKAKMIVQRWVDQRRFDEICCCALPFVLLFVIGAACSRWSCQHCYWWVIDQESTLNSSWHAARANRLVAHLLLD